MLLLYLIRAVSVRHSMTLKKGKQTLHFLCFISDINVLRKLFEKRGITFNRPSISAPVE